FRRRHRAASALWTVLGLVGLSWCLNVPGVVQFLRLPGLNMMSHNRLVFVTAFAVVVLAAIGLEAIGQGDVRWRGWYWLPAGLVGVLCVWCLYRFSVLPEPIATQLEAAVVRGLEVPGIRGIDAVLEVKRWFAQHFAAAAIWCALSWTAWYFLWKPG